MVVTDFVFHEYPDLPEGELAKLRASVVNADVLAELANSIDLGPALILGKGEDASGGRAKPSILADAMEAVIAAVYLDGGWDASPRPRDAAARGPHPRRGDGARWRRLQDRACRSSRRGAYDQLPRYQVRSRGPRPLEAVLRHGHAPRRAARKWRRAFQEAGRASRRARRVGPTLRERRRDGRTTAPRPRSRMPELPEVEVVRRDLEREIVGKKIKAVEVDGMRDRPPPPQPQAVHQPPRRQEVHRRRPARQVPPLPARRRRRARHSPRHVGSAAAREELARRRARSTPTS